MNEALNTIKTLVAQGIRPSDAISHAVHRHGVDRIELTRQYKVYRDAFKQATFSFRYGS